LFAECKAYLQAAQSLIAHGRNIATNVHGSSNLTRQW
jgi:hypothetical protein